MEDELSPGRGRTRESDRFEESPNGPKVYLNGKPQASGDDCVSQVTFEEVKNYAQKLKTVANGNNLNDLVDEFVYKLDMQLQLNSHNKTNKMRKEGHGEIPRKEFVIRESILTELFRINHFQTIYNIFVAILMLLFLNTVLYDFVDTGKFNLDFEMLFFAFGKSQVVLALWVLMKLSLIAILFPAFHYWAHTRGEVKNPRLLDHAFLVLFICYLTALMFIPLRILTQENLPPASSVIILAEQVRLFMKSYAFVRENIPRAKYYHPKKGDGDVSNSPCPDFGKFLYFLFAPTLVYRDSYPKTQHVRWRYVTIHLLQVLACMFYVYYIFQRFCVPVFQRFGREAFTPKSFLLLVFGSMMPGMLVLLVSFYAILHCWMNAFAEMLRFGDRMFYKDWWNSTTFANYYRTWNIVVHDWLYSYVYKEMYQLTGSKKLWPMFGVFMISALVHEYILSFAFKFFYPVLFFMFFGLGVSFVFLTNKGTSRSWNIFVWLAMFSGTGLLMSLYSMEWYARINCPTSSGFFANYILPRSWFCHY